MTEMHSPSHGILLVNLGTPASPSTRDVRRYLGEFLGDPRVLDIHPLARAALVWGLIVPLRGPASAARYRGIWSPEGSPLLRHGLRVRELLQDRLGAGYFVELAMRYQEPALGAALERLRRRNLAYLTVIPLFPQYASATTGSVHQAVMGRVSRWESIPELRLVSSFYDHPEVIEAFAENGRRHDPGSFDHVLFSFHGIPVRQLEKADASGSTCLKSPDCCGSLGPANLRCYRAQCHRMARLLAGKLELEKGRYTVCFQSRLGRAAWVEPYTPEVLRELRRGGARRVLVFCPSFVADCLETLHEIAIELAGEFVSSGGERLELVESLNESPRWVEALADMVTRTQGAAQRTPGAAQP